MVGTAAPKSAPIIVAVTGAAGQIAYSLLFSLAKGDVFGSGQDIELRLLDTPTMQQRVYGVMMEIQDCAFPLVRSMRQTDNADECFLNADVAILVGSMPRREGQQRADLLAKNGAIFQVPIYASFIG
jgi:malate/lactate dehydrogenase